MTITELAIKRPSIIIVIFIVLTILGLFGYQQLKYELLPDISIPVISITTIYPGASANEVESSVTKKIEDAVSTVDKVDAVHSTSQEGISVIIIEFLQNANLDFSLQDVQRKINQILADFPDGVKTPSLSKISVNDQPVLRIGVTSKLPGVKFYQYVKEQIKPQLSTIAGAGQITLIGGNEREIKVNIDSDRMRSCGVSISQVLIAIKSSNLDFPTGTVKDKDGQYTVRLAGKFRSILELKNLIIGKSKLGGDIKLSDIAEVQDGRKDFSNISRINGINSIGILIQKQSDANAVEVCRSVRKVLQRLESENRKIELKFDIAQDSSLFTIDAANAVKEDLAIAIILVAGVMLLFLHSFRNSFIVMIAIPASLVSTCIGMWAFGFTLNIVTLLALSLVIGILVDDSIVVLENIYRHLEQGKEPPDAALKGRNEIGFTALSITLVDVVVFVPLALVTGVIGGVMREFSVVVVVSTLMSLFVSFTITPWLASRFSKLEKLNKDTLMGRFGSWFETQFKKMTQLYINTLKWSLRNWGKVTTVGVLLFLAALSLIPLGFIGSEFIPQTDRGEFSIMLELSSRAKIEQTNVLTQQVEAILAKIPEVKKIFVNVGASSTGMIGQSSNNIAELQVILIPNEERSKSTDEIMRLIKAQLGRIPGLIAHVNSISIWGTSDRSPVQVSVSGPNWDDVYRTSKKVQLIVQKVPGTDDVRLSSEEGKPETRIEIDRDKMTTLGLTIADLGSTLQVGLTGDDSSKFRDQDGIEYSTRVMLDQSDRSKTSEIGGLTVVNRQGQPVEIKQFANIYQTVGPTKLQRIDRNYGITVSSGAVGRPSGSIGADIEKLLKQEKLPVGVKYTMGGDLEQQADSFQSLGLVLVAAIIFVYLVMVGLYDSFLYPLVVLFSVPLAVIGALFALGLTMNTLNIMSILGIIMQIGLVSKNAILLVDFIHKARADGCEAYEAIIWAGQERLRPILMTTLTMILGMLPIALSTAPGGEFKHGLGWALIGGLTCSMVMTLLVVPVVYLKIDQWWESLIGFRNRFSGKTTC